MRANSAVAASASTAPASAATPASPRHRQVSANTTSLSHSQANHGWPKRLKENGSATGACPVSSTSSPVRMCQPVSPSESSARKPCGWANAASNNARKKTSSTDGTNRRPSWLRSACVGTVADIESSNQIGPEEGFLNSVLELVLLAPRCGSR
jgi:hypothetical protein